MRTIATLPDLDRCFYFLLGVALDATFSSLPARILYSRVIKMFVRIVSWLYPCLSLLNSGSQITLLPPVPKCNLRQHIPGALLLKPGILQQPKVYH
jgi:hypothetical protein